MLHNSSGLTDPAIAYSPYSPYHPSAMPTSVSLSENHLTNGHPCTNKGLSPVTSAAVAALTAAAAASAGIPPNVKDSRWLTLEVCRQYQRNQCSRDENECKFAHPPTHVDVQNGRVVCCYDSIKGKCQRRDPPCKYLHPPQHLREQLVQNGRNNMIMRNMQMQLFQQHLIAQTGILPFNATTAMASPNTNSSPMNGTNNPNSILYPGPGQLTLGTTSTAYPFLNVGFAPYLSALTAGSNVPSELIQNDSTSSKRSQLNELKGGLSLIMPRVNSSQTNGTNGCGPVTSENHETSGPCVMVVNGHSVEPLKEMNGSSHGVPVTMRSTNGSQLTTATLYALQQPSQQTNLLNLSNHPNHAPPITSLSAASLAAIVNGSLGGGQLAPNHHYSAIAEHAGYFQPTYHIEIPPYPYH